MTDLEQYVDQPGRAELVKQVREKSKNWVLLIFITSSSLLPAASSVRAFPPTTGSAPPSAVFN